MVKRLLEGKNTIVTGSNRGIGYKTGEVFVANEAKLVQELRLTHLTHIVQDFLAKYGVTIKPVYFELTDFDQVKVAFKSIMADKLPVDVLLNNAGITYNVLF